MYKGGVIFKDHASGHVVVEPVVNFTAGEAIRAKKSYEREMASMGVTVITTTLTMVSSLPLNSKMSWLDWSKDCLSVELEPITRTQWQNVRLELSFHLPEQ